MSVGEIERRAQNLWGEAFQDRTSVGALYLPDASARMSAARKINAILFETMRDSFAVVSLRGCREVENAVLDTLLSSVPIAHGLRARVFVTKSRAKQRSIFGHVAVTPFRFPICALPLAPPVGLSTSDSSNSTACRPCNTSRHSPARCAEDLTNTRGRDLRVTDVAMKWGFEHLGRFALAYRDFFGELPSAHVGLRARYGTLDR